MPPEKSVDSMAVEITHLQQGLARIEKSIDKNAEKLDGMFDALTTLIRLTEKHDALADRVTVLEETAKQRETVAHRGEAYMNATKYLLPLALGVIIGMVGWLVDRVDDHDTEIKEMKVAESAHHGVMK